MPSAGRSRLWGVQPDFMCTAKAITNGYFPFGAVMIAEGVAEVFEGDETGRAAIGHGYTYSGHPVGAAAALACREKGGLVSLTLVTDRLPKKLEKPSVILITILSIVFSAILFKYGMDKVLTQLANGKRTFVLNWPEWIFWSFVPIGAGCMILHFIEYCLDFCLKKDDEKEDK